MAQVTGGSDVDFFWEHKTSAALRLLREASDTWATKGRDAISVAFALDAFMSVLARPGGWPRWQQVKWPSRFLEGVDPPTAASSCVELARRCTSDAAVGAVKELLKPLNAAADEWAVGHPEEPKTRDVLHELLDILWRWRIAPVPASKKYPREV